MATPLPPDGFADRPSLHIDLTALAANYTILQKASGKAQCAAVVKADAYGLGMDETVPVLLAAGCRHFFVAQLAEGVRLRHIISACAESDKSFDASAIYDNKYETLGVYPNPATDVLNIENHSNLISLSIYSVTGKLMVQTSEISGSIDISNFADGMYTVSAVGKDGLKYHTKFMVK